MFFDEDSTAAITYCADCPVTLPCLAYGISIEAEFGVWGGVKASKFRGRKDLPARSAAPPRRSGRSIVPARL